MKPPGACEDNPPPMMRVLSFADLHLDPSMETLETDVPESKWFPDPLETNKLCFAYNCFLGLRVRKA